MREHTCCKLSLDLAPSSKKSLESRRVEPTVVSLKGFIDIFSATIVGCHGLRVSTMVYEFLLDKVWSPGTWIIQKSTGALMFFQAVATIFRKPTMFIFDSLLGKELKTLKNLMNNTRKSQWRSLSGFKKKQLSGHDSQLSSCKLPSCELMYPIARHSWRWYPFLQVGDFSSLEGKLLKHSDTHPWILQCDPPPNELQHLWILPSKWFTPGPPHRLTKGQGSRAPATADPHWKNTS